MGQQQAVSSLVRMNDWQGKWMGSECHCEKSL